MSKQMSRMLIYVSIFFVLIFGVYGVKKIIFYYYVSHYQPAPATISAAPAKSEAWRPYLTAVGSLSAVNGVDISPEVSGIVKTIHFQSGQVIKQGDLLITMLSENEKANLKFNQAKLQLAKINYEREQQLYSKKVASKATLDTRYAELQEAEASVQLTEAQIRQKTIRAPFDGKLGIRQVNLGQFISPGSSVVTLQSLDPLHVTFNLPEQNLPQLFIGQEVEVVVNFEKHKSIKGTISAINSKVDAQTRNILVETTIPNADEALYPGMYALVKIWLNKNDQAVIVPQTAISYSLSGDYVFIVKEEEKDGVKESHVYRQYIKVGERRDKDISILDGLNAGDMVVTSGQIKLQNGAKVVIDNTVDL